ncbi:hypothetical protein R1flu_023715 [Riccia fluitans]|uniref:Uncharacterized protein n=1 Tax=Riccia fluitans TaxID=41844 RepID=A0ABD1XST5_9MARC
MLGWPSPIQLPTPDWGDAVEKIMSRQIKALGVCNEATCIGPYLAHLYSHFHEMDAKDKEDSKKREASGSKPLDLKIDYDEWGIRLESLGHETSKLFEAFHMEVGSVTTEAVARNMREMFAPPPVAEADLQPWKEMVKNLANFLTKDQKRNKAIVEQRDYFKGKTRHSEKIPEIAMWCVQQLQTTLDVEAPLLATVEMLKKILTEHGIPIPPKVAAD